MNNVTIQVDNVRSKVINLPIDISAELASQFSVDSPNYWFSPRFRQGLWDGKVKFFQRPANTFPTGILSKVIETLKKHGITPEIVDKRFSGAKGYVADTYQLNPIEGEYHISDDKIARSYQVDALNNVIDNNVSGIPFMRGVINIATNGGKTAIAIALLKELYPLLVDNDAVFLFVTHSKEIATQARSSISNDLGIDVGLVGDGQWNVKNVTVALVPTLYKRRQKDEFKELVKRTVGFIADECHHSSSDSWYKVFNSLTNALIRIGLTGTVDKANPVNEMKLYSCTGPVIHKISNDYLINQGYSAKPICIMFTITTPELGEENYQDAYALGIVDNEERLDTIYEICKKETDANNTVLILVEHIEHGNNILEVLEPLGRRVYFTNGTLTTERRQELLDDLKDGELDVLISTSILDEGVDVSNINALIYARGMKSSRKLLQGIGRGLRKKQDGSKLRFYDFIDDTNLSLLIHSQSRYKTLSAEGFTIKAYSLDDYVSASLEDIDNE